MARGPPLGSRTQLTGRVPVLKANGGRLAGMEVTAVWTFAGGQTTVQQATSGPTGQAVFRIMTRKHGTVKLCVLDMSKEWWVYDPAANVETCDQIVVPYWGETVRSDSCKPIRLAVAGTQLAQ